MAVEHPMPLEDSELEQILPRCKTKDKHEFPELKEDERCHNCILWEAIDKHALRERIAELKSLRNQDRYTNRDSYADVRIHKLQGQLNALEGKDEAK